MPENHVTFVGRLTADPELKFINSGKAVVKFTLAVDKSHFNRQTNQREKGESSFFNCTVWDKMGENVAASLKKGYRVIVNGTMEQRSWETESGEKRSVFEVVVEAIGPDLRFVTCELRRNEAVAARAAANALADDEDPF